MLRAALVVLIVVSVGLKVAADQSKPPVQNLGRDIDRLGAELARAGFDVSTGTYAAAPYVEALRGSCRLAVVEARPQGWNIEAIRKLAVGGAVVQFAYGGVLSPDPPRVTATIGHHWDALLGSLGLPVKRRPMFGLIVHPDCGTVLHRWLGLSDN